MREARRYNRRDPALPLEAHPYNETLMISAPQELLAALALGSLAVASQPVQDAPLESAAAALEVLSNEDLASQLTTLAQSPQAELSTLATSRGGRAVQLLEVHGAGGSAGAPRPAILVTAGLDGAHAYTSSIVLDHARRLVEGYGQDEAVTQLLDSTTIYLVPRLDVDAAAARFATPLAEVHGTGTGVDNDRDGRQGEDPAADINQDGFITLMRAVDPEGEWVTDPTDPRAMRKADRASGERGVFKLYTEGLDSDGDDRVAEDSVHDAAVNRNFARGWAEHAADCGRYPGDEPAVLGVMEFALDHPELALVLTYGDEGNLVEKPETQPNSGPSKRGAMQTGIFEADAEVYVELGKRYRELTGNKTKGLGEQPGSLQAWAYHHRGLFTLNVTPWSVPLDAKPASEGDQEPSSEENPDAGKSSPASDSKEGEQAKPSDQAKQLIWLDQNAPGSFLDWTAFEHPQLGAVEVGGFKPYALVEPTSAELGASAEKHFRFLTSLGELLPRPELTEVTLSSKGGGLYEARAVLENDALLPLQSHAASRSRTIQPAQVMLELPEGATLVAGQLRTLVSELAPTGGRLELHWLVTLRDPSDPPLVRMTSKNAGEDQKTLEVK